MNVLIFLILLVPRQQLPSRIGHELKNTSKLVFAVNTEQL